MWLMLGVSFLLKRIYNVTYSLVCIEYVKDAKDNGVHRTVDDSRSDMGEAVS